MAVLRKTRTRTEVRAAAVTTTIYVATTPVDLVSGIRGEFAGFALTIVKGDVTSLEFILEVGDADAVAATDAHWFKVAKATGAIDERTVAAASLAATDYLAVFQDVNLTPYSKVRLKIKSTGGTPTGTVKVDALYGGNG